MSVDDPPAVEFGSSLSRRWSGGRKIQEPRASAGSKSRPRSLLPDGTATEFRDDIQVTEVPGVLLEEVEQNPFESGGFGAVPAGGQVDRRWLGRWPR